MPNPPTLYAIGGPPASGKLKIVEYLLARLGAEPVVEIIQDRVFDEIADSIARETGTRPLQITPSMQHEAARIIDERAIAALKSGKHVIVKDMFLTAGARDAFETLAKKHGANFQGLWIDAPLAVKLERVKNTAFNQSINRATAADIISAEENAPANLRGWHKIDTANWQSAFAELENTLKLPELQTLFCQEVHSRQRDNQFIP